MGETTGIAWTDATFNPWWGCTKVSPGCDHCYAEALDRRVGGDHWGPGRPRRKFGDKHWNEPKRWNVAAYKAGVRRKVFCASMADVFDNEAPKGARDRLWNLIRETPWLTWQIVTKRIGNAEKMLPADWGRGYPNVWLLITVINQEEADRDTPKLLQIPAVVRGWSAEPLLGPIKAPDDFFARRNGGWTPWVIVGGESGPGARPCWVPDVRSIVRQCRKAGVAVFVKQLGANVQDRNDTGFDGCEPHAWPDIDPFDIEHDVNGYREEYQGAPVRIRLRDRKGGDPAEWPEDLRIREFPK